MNSKTIVPIFHAHLMLSVTNNIKTAREAENETFGLYLLGEGVAALASSEGKYFALFFDINDIDYGKIAHEIFHCTCRILDWVGGKFDINNHEQYAYLCEWITDWVYGELKENNIEVK